MKENPSEPQVPTTAEEAAAAMNVPIGARAQMLEDELTFEARRKVEEARDALHRRIENDFRYHPPAGPDQTETYTAIRRSARKLAHELVDRVPPSRELSTALTKLEECVMHANAGVARGGGS